MFVVLDGDGTLCSATTRSPVRAGHVVSRPAGTGVAHTLRAGPSGLRLSRLRDPGAGRHLLLPALEQDRVSRPRRDRPARAARLLGRGGLSSQNAPIETRRAVGGPDMPTGRARGLRQLANPGAERHNAGAANGVPRAQLSRGRALAPGSEQLGRDRGPRPPGHDRELGGRGDRAVALPQQCAPTGRQGRAARRPRRS